MTGSGANPATVGSDFTVAQTSPLSFDAGTNSRVIVATTVPDTTVEADEQFTVTLGALGGNGSSQLGAATSATGTISNDDAAGSVTSINLLTIDGSNGFRLLGTEVSDFSGSSVRGAGDVNGDGLADVIIGAPGARPVPNDDAGRAFVIFGTLDGTLRDGILLNRSDLDGTTRGFSIDGATTGNRTGFGCVGGIYILLGDRRCGQESPERHSTSN